MALVPVYGRFWIDSYCSATAQSLRRMQGLSGCLLKLRSHKITPGYAKVTSCIHLLMQNPDHCNTVIFNAERVLLQPDHCGFSASFFMACV